MKRYTQQHIQDLLDKFMNGLTTLEEEAALGDYFRTHEVPQEWEDYRQMFGYFDRGMEGEVIMPQAQEQPFMRLMGRRWWGIAAAACITAAIVATAVLHQPESTTTVPETPPVASNETPPIEETQDVASLHETEPSPETSITRPVETQNLASRAAKRKSAHKDQRRLQAENAKLARENERLQRELADLKRRAFIIDLEANGFRAVQDEDGSIVLIDLEQEIENELNNQLNNQPTTNIPAL